MNKFMRVCAVLLAVGVVLCIVGAATGGGLYSSIVDGELRPFGGATRQHGESHADHDSHTGAGRGSGSVWTPAVPSRADLPDIPDNWDDLDDIPEPDPPKALDFELGAGNYTIVAGDSCGIECEGAWLESELKNGVWKLRSDVKWSNLGLGEARNCMITIPEGCSFEKVDWDLGAANVEVRAPVAADKLELELGAANVEFYEAVEAGKASAEVGGGNLEFYSLGVSDKLELEVGAGNFEAVLAGSWDGYRIKADVAMGTVAVNGAELVSGLAGSCSQGDGPCRIEVDIGMGNVEIYTEE